MLGEKQQTNANANRVKKDEIRKDNTNAGPMGLDPNQANTTQSKVPLKTID